MTSKLNSTFTIQVNRKLTRQALYRIEEELFKYADNNEEYITDIWIKDDNNKTYSGAFEVVAKSKTIARSYIENVKDILSQMGKVEIETEEGV